MISPIHRQTSTRPHPSAASRLILLVFVSGLLLHGPVRAVLPEGDITQDGEVNLADYLHGLQHVIGNRTLLGDAVTQGDVAPLLNGVPDPNGTLDAAEYEYTRAAIAQKRKNWPIAAPM